MACFHGKETSFGRDKGYHICRNEASGKLRCPCGTERSCPLFMDDRKDDDLTTLLHQSRHQSTVSRSLTMLAVERALAPAFKAALAQTPDGGDDYYDHLDPRLPDIEANERFLRLFAK